MTKRFTIQFTKTYASEATALIAVKKYLNTKNLENANLVYTIMPTFEKDRIRYGVAFLGQSAIDHHIHFDWNVIAF